MNVEDLARKYRSLVALRDERARSGAVAETSVLRALAHEFPGALREIDRSPMSVLRERLAHVEAVARGDTAREPWVGELCAWHAHMAAALQVKRSLSRARELTDARAAELAERAAEGHGVAMTLADVRAIASPPRGRVTALVWAWRSQLASMSEDALRQMLFPEAPSVTRRP